MLAQIWQKINVQCHICHSWQDVSDSIITAMTFLIILLVVAAIMSAETVRRVLHDGAGPQRPPLSHFDDPQFRAPAAG